MRHLARRFEKPGSAPGKLEAGHDGGRAALHVMRYGPEGFEEAQPADLEAARPLLEGGGVRWLDVVGLGDIELLEELGRRYGLHPLALEDVVHVGQRPKLEEYGGQLFVVARLFQVGERLDSEQICLFVGPGWVITFQERAGDTFEPVRERIRHGRGRIRRHGADYLTYALLDSVVDHLFPILEHFGERLEQLEEAMVEAPAQETLEQLHRIKKELLLLRKAVWPQRELVSRLERTDSELVGAETRVFLRDCYDHAIQTMDLVETYRDLASGLMDLYLSSVSNRMNEVMKVLTVMASIFIPLTFLAGIYGMNFDPAASPFNMPELSWYWGYPAFWAAILALGGGLVWAFRRKGWL